MKIKKKDIVLEFID